MPGLPKHDSAHVLAVEPRVESAQFRGVRDEQFGLGKLTSKQARRLRPICAPPEIDLVNLRFSFGSEVDLHPRAKSLPITSSASTRFPALAWAILRLKAS
jgi:hypothetical protein